MLTSNMKSIDSTLVSVVVPVYGVEKYVEKCLDSLSHQGYENIEVIVVDDGSTDRSGDICEEFAKNEYKSYILIDFARCPDDVKNYFVKHREPSVLC